MRGALLHEIAEHKSAILAFETVLTLSPTAPERVAIKEKIKAVQKDLDAL